MAAGNETESIAPADSIPKQVGVQLNLVKLLFSRPEFGFFFLVVLLAESALVFSITRAASETEREIELAAFVVLLLAALLVFYKALPTLLPPKIVPDSLSAAPIPPAEAERRPDLIYAPDATFAFGEPPENWTYNLTTVADDVAKLFQTQLLGDGDGAAILPGSLPFQPGTMVVFNERGAHTISYLPGRSTINGRAFLGALDEVFREQIQIFSVSKRGSAIREVTAEHVFAQMLGGISVNGARVVEIAHAPAVAGRRSALTARAIAQLDDVRIDGAEPQSAGLEGRLYVVERASFIYVIQATHFLGAKWADARRKEIDKIIDSFQPVSPADAEMRGRRDQAQADEAWDRVMRAVAPDILASKAKTLVGQIAMMDGRPQISERQLANMRTLAGYAQAYPDFVPKELAEALDAWRRAADEAWLGRPEALADIIAEVRSEAPALSQA